MIRRIANIAVLFTCTLSLSFAKAKNNQLYFIPVSMRNSLFIQTKPGDTLATKKKQDDEEKNKVKVIGKSKKLPKPQKIEPRRQRRPEGLDRPPEIPRRNGG